MSIIHFVITNGGDGSNGIQWVKDQEVLDLMEEAADSGGEAYASGDGLQYITLKFPESFDLDAWAKLNHISFATADDVRDW